MSRAPSPAGTMPAPVTAVPQRRRPRRRARRSRRRARRCSRCRPRCSRDASPGARGRRGTGRRRRPPGTPSASRSGAPGPCTASTARSCVVSSAADGVDAPGRCSRRSASRRRRRSARRRRRVPPHDDVVEHRRRRRRRAGGCTGPGPGPILPRSLVSVRCSRSSASAPVDPHGAEVRDVEHHGVARGRRGARRWCPSGTRAACPSRRTAPCGRRGCGGWRRAASARGVIRRLRTVRRRRRRAAHGSVASSRGQGRELGVDVVLHAGQRQHVEHALALAQHVDELVVRRTARPGCR